MSAQTDVQTAELTDYEAEQVNRIAAWKAEHPDPLSELFKLITRPGIRLVEKAIPDELVRTAIEAAYRVSERISGQEDIKRKAGVQDLAELRHSPLEECDRLAHGVSLTSQGYATVEGVLTGAGGLLTTALDIPLLFSLALRTVMRIGHCYGYALDQSRDEPFVLGVLIAAVSGSRERKHEVLGKLREIEDWLIEQTQEEMIAEEAMSMLFQLEVFEEVPGLGAISGGLLNYVFMRKVDIGAMRVFQERWLHDNGKVDVIEPATLIERAGSTGRWDHVLSRAVYAGCYYLGFGVALPAFFVASALGSKDNAMTRGLRGGATAATEDVDRLLARLRNAAESSAPPALGTSVAHAPA